MKHNPNASPGEGQSDGPRPQLLLPLGTLLPGLGPRPSFLSSWPLSWGCSIGKGPTGGPFCDPSSWMGAAPTQGQLLLQSDTSHLRYHHQSHSTTTALTYTALTHHSHIPLSHTPLSHIPLSHTALTHHSHTHHSHTHRSHTLLSHTTLTHTHCPHTHRSLTHCSHRHTTFTHTALTL